MAYNKIVLGNKTLIDLSGDTVEPHKIIRGYTAHAADGSIITGDYDPSTFYVDEEEQTLVIECNDGTISPI